MRVNATINLGGVITPADGGGGTLSTYWAPSLTTVQPGIALTAGRKGVQARYVRLQIPALGIDTDNKYGGSGNGSIEALLEIDGLTWHMLTYPSILWRVSWSAMRLYRDGVEVWSIGSGSYADPLTCGRVAPTGLPLFGVPPTLSAACQALMPQAADCSIPIGSTDIYADVGPHTVNVQGGWRWRETPSSNWVESPVRLSMVSPPAPSNCQCQTPSMSWPSATTTWDASLYATIGGTGGSTFSGYRREMSITLVPDLPRAIWRQNPDYGALWVRGGAPGTDHLGVVQAHRCLGQHQPSSDCSESETSVVHTPATQMLSIAEYGSGVIDEPLALPLLAPYSTESYVYNLAPWPTNCSVLRKVSYPALQNKSQAMPVLRPQDDLACYIDTRANPHWSYLYWFPPPVSDPDEPLHDWEWPLDGGRVPSDLYWIPLRTQWLHHPALPYSPDWRNLLHWGALKESPFRELLKTNYFPVYTSWIGLTRPLSIPVSGVPSSVSTNASSSGQWTVTGCTYTFGNTAITLGAGTNRVAELTTMPWMVSPRGYERWMGLIGVYWPASLVSSVKIESIDRYGASGVIYQGTTVPGALQLPTFAQTKYAGTWAIDRGLGLTTDLGTDAASGGVSQSLMGGVDGRTSLALGKTSIPAKIRFTVTPISSGTSIGLNYPVRYRTTQTARIFRPDAHSVDIVWPGDGCMHLGDAMWYDGLNLLQTPMLYDRPERQNLVDHLADWATVWSNQPSSGMIATGAGWFDSIELQDWRDMLSDTMGSWVTNGATPRLIATNLARELPPHIMMPRKLWDGASETGALGLWSYDLATTVVWHVTSGSGAVTMTGTPPVSSIQLPGWLATGYRRPTTNDEFVHLWRGEKKIAYVRPWWGSLSSLLDPASGTPTLRTAIACWLWGIRSWGTDEAVAAYDPWQTPVSGPSYSLSGPATSLSAAFSRDGVAYLAAGPRLYVSHDGGATYTSMTVTGTVQLALVPGGRYALAVDGDGWVRLIDTHGTTLYPCVFGPGQLRIVPGSLSVAEETSSSRRWYIGCQLYGQTDVSWLVSDDDGQSWRQL